MPDEVRSLLEACTSELATEVEQRRWGRGFAYFLDRWDSTNDTQRVGLARDILEFLREPYGLMRAKEGRSGALRRAVDALEQECIRVVREEPTPVFAWGVIQGRGAQQEADIQALIQQARGLEPQSGATFTFNPVVQLPRAFGEDWTGLGRLYVSDEQRLASLKMSPPAHIVGRDLRAFLVESIGAGLDRMDDRIIKKRLAWSTEPHRSLLARLAAN